MTDRLEFGCADHPRAGRPGEQTEYARAPSGSRTKDVQTSTCDTHHIRITSCLTSSAAAQGRRSSRRRRRARPGRVAIVRLRPIPIRPRRREPGPLDARGDAVVVQPGEQRRVVEVRAPPPGAAAVVVQHLLQHRARRQRQRVLLGSRVDQCDAIDNGYSTWFEDSATVLP